jgi:DNA-binding response OmpR family regulator
VTDLNFPKTVWVVDDEPVIATTLTTILRMHGYAILYYGDSPRRMQINEIFKILDGRIRMVDNIGLMEDGITTSGFTH